MNTEKARAALLKARKINKGMSDAQVRQVWRDLTDEKRKECMDKITGDKDVADNDSGKVRSSTKRTPGDGGSADVSV